jgi:hypothetical protein
MMGLRIPNCIFLFERDQNWIKDRFMIIDNDRDDMARVEL